MKGASNVAGSTTGDVVRLTVAQAMVKFLGRQYSERDGVKRKLFAGCFGIFGHGNIAGLGSETAVLVHVDTDLEYQSPGGDGWWDVPVAEVSDFDFTQEARRTYEGFTAMQRPLL